MSRKSKTHNTLKNPYHNLKRAGVVAPRQYPVGEEIQATGKNGLNTVNTLPESNKSEVVVKGECPLGLGDTGYRQA